ncbi:MAG: NAD-dependent epimerase/dehydratase family protein [Candidatus Kryptoniota bacterium]
MNLYTILGGGGVVADELSRLLIAGGKNVRVVSRSGHGIQGAAILQADISFLDQAVEAVKNSSVTYLCVGLKYDRKLWAEKWPAIMANTIEACKRAKSKLVFLDNVYSYGKVDGAMVESTPYNPCSRKGEIRAEIANELISEVKAGDLRALIARAADFYGPCADKTGVPNILVFKPFSHRKKANWLVNDRVKHSFTFTLDIAKALLALSESDEAYGQVWHLPTASNPLTGKEFIDAAAKEFGVAPKYRVLAGWMMRLAGLSDKTTAELYEMLYQSKDDYIFDSSKFQNAFRIEPVSYEDGIRDTVKYYKSIQP